jgi:predicted DCC family thiol-disulfide oxidoreductase YuxK
MTTAPRKAYSYRTDPSVPPFDDAAPLLIFDGKCVLCSSGVQWMLKRDPDGATRFAAIQEEIPRALYAHYDLDADQFDTFMVLAEGRPHLKWAGALAAARTMPAPWSWLGQAGRLVPAALGDRLYDILQRNRLTWFGRRETCLVPSPADRRRFLVNANALT